MSNTCQEAPNDTNAFFVCLVLGPRRRALALPFVCSTEDGARRPFIVVEELSAKLLKFFQIWLVGAERNTMVLLSRSVLFEERG